MSFLERWIMRASERARGKTIEKQRNYCRNSNAHTHFRMCTFSVMETTIKFLKALIKGETEKKNPN